MTTRKIQEFEPLLRAQRVDVLAAIRAALHTAGEAESLALLNHLEAAGDWAEADLQSDTDIALLGNELTQLREIDAALARIKGGTYGACAGCGEPIAAARLAALPTAQRCLHCQESFEKQHGDVHGASL